MSDDGFGPPEVGGGNRTGTRAGAPRRDADPAAGAGAAGGAGGAGGDGFLPSTSGRSRLRLPRPGLPRRLTTGRPRLRRPRLRRVLAAVMVLVLLAVLGGLALVLTASASMRRERVEGLATRPPLGGPMHVLVVGSDSREGFTPEELQALGTEAVDGRRTDTMFVLSLQGGRAAQLSLPRDLYVTRCDGSRGRINGAYAQGGPSCLVATVRALTGIPLTSYVEVNLFGFSRIVDAVGGVRMALEEPMVDVAAGVDLPAGCQVLDGRQAVGFVRARHVDDDLGRIARQQRFLAELAAEVQSPATLLNPVRLARLARAGGGALTVDHRFGPLDLLRLARGGRGLAGAGVASHTVPATPEVIGGAAVLVPRQAEAAALFARFASGAVLEGEPAPGDVELVVRNGAGTPGLASTVQQRLAAEGFRVAEVGNAEPVTRTVVRHPPGAEAAAGLVAARFPGATTEVADGPLTLVLGPDAASGGSAGPPSAEEPAPPSDGAAPAVDTPTPTC